MERKLKGPIKYYGGKERIAARIAEQIHQIPHTVYSEPFFGGGAVFYAKGKYDRGNNNNYREAVNDKNDSLMTFWRCARDEPEELRRLIDLTLYSQSEYKLAKRIYCDPGKHSLAYVAWAAYVLCNMSFAAGIGKGWGAGVIGPNLAVTWDNRKKRLPECFERLSGVHIGCEDALRFIDRWDSPQTLHYCDPPYPGTSQGHYSGYDLEDYAALIEKLDQSKGSYILSNYAQGIAPKSAQRCVEIESKMSAANGKQRRKLDAKRTERLWICDRSSGMRADLAKIAQMPDRNREKQLNALS